MPFVFGDATMVCMRFDTTKALPIALGVAMAFAAVAAGIFVWGERTPNEPDAEMHQEDGGTSEEQREASVGTNDEDLPEETTGREPEPTPPKPAVYTTRIEGYSAILTKDGKAVQTITLEGFERSGAEFLMENNLIKSPFETGEDINFDGRTDLSAAVSYGYEGRNKYYNYYVFNPKTERYERDPLLTELVNPRFYKGERYIWTGEISGDYSYQTIYSFDGKEYVKGDPKVVCMNEEVCGD